MHQLRFYVYEYSLVIKDTQLITRKFLVLKDNDKNIVAWTNYHEYIRSGKIRPARNISDDGNMRFYTVCKFLNYIYFDRYQIHRLTDLTLDMVKNYLNDYGMGNLKENDTDRTETTVNICILHIMDFLNHLLTKNKGKFRFTVSDLYTERKVYNMRTHRMEPRKVPIFDVHYSSKPKEIFRDMPDSVFRIFLDYIITNHKEILMLVALGAFAGMRPSECCNVRRSDSPLGSGIRISLIDDEITDIIIDLSKELNLRSDLKPVGAIKKERIQRVYPAFLKPFYECYQIYMNYIEGHTYEADYGALTVNKQGKAITYDNYYQKFQKVVAGVIPILLKSEDPQVVDYGYQLQEHRISPHVFRHWFSVRLTIFGEDVAGLMYWRGDHSPDSALTYLVNKSELTEKYKKVTNEIFEYNMWRAEHVHKND